MTSINGTRRGAGRRAWVTPVLALAVAVSLAGCDSLIDVQNPNNVSEGDFRNPISAAAIAAGILSEVQDAWEESLLPYATATDELKWVGSRDSWKQLEEGDLSDRTNEFTDAAFPQVTEARWLSDEGIALLEEFVQQTEVFVDPLNLANAYLYGGILYVSIADRWDDFVISSSKLEAGPPVGEANMGSLYDKAIDYLTKGLAIATTEGDAALRRRFLAMRAVAVHRKAMWNVVQPSLTGTPPIYVPLPASAIQDANDALTLIGTEDWAFYFIYSAATRTNTLGFWINERLEHRVDDRYAVADPSDKTVVSTALMDPIDDNVPDPELDEIIFDEVTCCRQESPLRITSVHELYLILAEHAIASSNDVNNVQAIGYINALRALNELTPFNPVTHAPLTAADLVRHHRMASLFMHGVRLSDMYRFGVTDPRWVTGSEARTQPGTFLPITAVECNANPGACS